MPAQLAPPVLQRRMRVPRRPANRDFVPFTQMPPAPARLKPGDQPPIIKAGEIADAGQFGTTGSLPTNPGEIDPPILTSGGPSMIPRNDYWTRFDPNMGHTQTPTLQINPSQSYPELSGPASTERTLGEHLLGNRLLNPFARRRESWQKNAASNPAEPWQHNSASNKPAWFQPGYQPPAGIQGAIARGDYSRAYGPTERSLASSRVMASQAMPGNPNNMAPFASEGRFLTSSEGEVTQFGDQTNYDPSGVFRMSQKSGAPKGVQRTDEWNQWLMAQPEYQKWMAKRVPREGGGTDGRRGG